MSGQVLGQARLEADWAIFLAIILRTIGMRIGIIPAMLLPMEQQTPEGLDRSAHPQARGAPGRAKGTVKACDLTRAAEPGAGDGGLASSISSDVEASADRNDRDGRGSLRQADRGDMPDPPDRGAADRRQQFLRCWADGREFHADESSKACLALATHPLGLCPRHLTEILGERAFPSPAPLMISPGRASRLTERGGRGPHGREDQPAIPAAPEVPARPLLAPWNTASPKAKTPPSAARM